MSKILKVEFEIVITSILAEYKSPFTFKIAMKRGDKTQEIEKPYKYTSGNKEIPLDEPFKLETHLEINTDQGTVSEKIIKYYLLVLTSNGYKPATNGELNLSVLDFENENNLTLDFKKHSLNFLKIKFKVFPTKVDIIEFNTQLLKEETFQYLGSSSTNDLNLTMKTVDQSFHLSNTLPKNNITSNTTNQSNPIKPLIKPATSTVVTSSISSLSPKNSIIKKESIDEISLLKEKLKTEEIENKKLREEIEKIKNENKTNGKNDFSEELTEKNKVIESLKEEITIINNENHQLNGIIKDIKSEKTKIYNEKISISKELKLKEEELLNIKDQFSKNEEMIKIEKNNLTSQLNEKSSQLAKFEKMKIENEKNKKENEEKINKLTKENKEEKVEKERLIKENKEMIVEVNKVSMLLNEIENNKSTFDLLKNENIQYKNELQNLNSKLVTLQSNEINDDEKKKKLLESQELINHNLQLKIKSLQEEITQLKRRNEEYEKEISNQMLEMNHIKDEKDNYIQLEKRFKEEMIVFKDKLSEKNEEIKKFNDEILNLKKENGVLIVKCNKIKDIESSSEETIKKIEDFKLKMEVKEKDMEMEIEVERNKHNKEMMVLIKDKEILEGKILQIESSLLSIQKENLALKERIKNKESELLGLNDEQNKYNEYEKRIVQLENEIIKQKVELADEKKKYNDIEERSQINECLFKEFKDKIMFLEKELMVKTEQIGELLNEISELERNNTTHEAGNNNINIKANNLKKSGFLKNFFNHGK